jgi:hypothetical protein
MNSDPHESAAWRAFGILDAEESAAFDDALRENADLRHASREINALAVAIAVSQVKPLQTRVGDFERLQTRLGLLRQRPVNWLGITGWAIAASLALLLVVNHRARHMNLGTTKGASATPESVSGSPAKNDPEAAKMLREDNKALAISGTSDGVADGKETKAANKALAISGTSDGVADGKETKAAKKGEAMKLIQVVSVLREKLEKVAKRDQKRFEIVAGRSWPVMMTWLRRHPLMTTKQPSRKTPLP